MGQFRFGIIASDYEKSLAFYRNGLGLRIVSSWDRGIHDKGALFEFANGILEIIPCSEMLTAANSTGVWLYVEVDNVDAWYERALEKQIPILLQPTNEPWGHRRCKIKDPDGIGIGLFSILPYTGF